MFSCIFASDLHGSVGRYESLFTAMVEDPPDVVLLGGDLFPSGLAPWEGPAGSNGEFLDGFLVPGMEKVRSALGEDYPHILVILGNDDMKTEEAALREAGRNELWDYIQGERRSIGTFDFYGYAYVPPTPFLWKDWERYDVSRYVPPGCVSPEEGWRTVEVSESWNRYGSIKDDLEELTVDADLAQAVFLFHTPPYDTKLDRAALDGKMVDHVPMDLHVGSIAVRRFIQTGQPLLTLHGHIHESPRLTGAWQDRIGDTLCFSAAHDGPELALVRFDLENPSEARRLLL